MTKAFISYHHENDQDYKHHLTYLAREYGAFVDRSLPVTGIPDDNRSSQSIRRQIRDDFLRDSEVTILLCGRETRGRKHVDWELKSSMINGRVNRKSGILVINLPGVAGGWTAALPNEKKALYGHHDGAWTSFKQRSQFEEKYPLMPARIVDNLMKPDVAMSVIQWERIENNPAVLRWLVDATAIAGSSNDYDLSRAMRRNNSARAQLTLADLLAPQTPSNMLGLGASPRNALADYLDPSPSGLGGHPRNALLEALNTRKGR
ncbi:TIR domain-containing protein [uncultured Roseobacter sp.]|uniref:TIR domain-containing protein n=1 Tax=uncultured Roseobacter sp. TaxID=114847 RepID=UPI002632D1D3|nr:TIR domain-containing protein [uncultured Roseobacter sp.]